VVCRRPIFEVQTNRQFPGSQVFAAKLCNESSSVYVRPEGNGQENRSRVYAQAERQESVEVDNILWCIRYKLGSKIGQNLDTIHMCCILFSSCNLITHCLDFGGYIAQADNHPVIQISLIQPVRIVKKMNLRNRVTVMIPYFPVVGVLCCVCERLAWLEGPQGSWWLGALNCSRRICCP
jgi:hypothetical protein